MPVPPLPQHICIRIIGLSRLLLFWFSFFSHSWHLHLVSSSVFQDLTRVVGENRTIGVLFSGFSFLFLLIDLPRLLVLLSLNVLFLILLLFFYFARNFLFFIINILFLCCFMNIYKKVQKIVKKPSVYDRNWPNRDQISQYLVRPLPPPPLL